MKLSLNYKNNNLIKIVFIIFAVIVVSISAFFSVGVIERRFFYPVKYLDEIKTYSNRFNLDISLVISVIRVESSFDKNATSNKGAKGLMQLTDSTAKFVSKMLNVNFYDVYDIDTNILFGSRYIRYLLDRFGDEDLAIIAYNAGEGNLAKWLNDCKNYDKIQFINNVPFNETRDYFAKIIKTRKKYKKLYPQIVDK